MSRRPSWWQGRRVELAWTLKSVRVLWHRAVRSRSVSVEWIASISTSGGSPGSRHPSGVPNEWTVNETSTSTGMPQSRISDVRVWDDIG